MLVDAKQAFDRNAGSGRIQGDRLVQAEHQLAICEGSDWFWWFGDLNPAEAVGDFEHLYRQQLANLYQLIGEEPPQYLSQVFTRGSGAPAMGGVMRPGVAG
jgi:alpha-amylase/alpha-mannosidase (GH57 family)